MSAPAKRFYLSFADETGFRGGCVVEVLLADIERLWTPCYGRILQRRREVGKLNVPIADEHVILAIAHTLAGERGCNPGGQVASWVLNEKKALPYGLELFHLYSREELERWEGVR